MVKSIFIRHVYKSMSNFLKYVKLQKSKLQEETFMLWEKLQLQLLAQVILSLPFLKINIYLGYSLDKLSGVQIVNILFSNHFAAIINKPNDEVNKVLIA